MLRPLAVIISAILLSRPELQREDAEHWARVLQQEAKQRDFDPLTGVAIIHFESGWHPGVVSPNGEDYGLGQIRARYIGACKRDKNPKDAPGPDCKAVKQSLLDADTNIRTMAQLISDNRKLCLDKVKTASLPRWLASYQGLNFPKQGKWCKPGEKTWRVIKYRNYLLQEVAKSKRTPKSGG
jgi:Transglycosylase SLT domain